MQCKACDGTGFFTAAIGVPGAEVKCSVCGGTGTLTSGKSGSVPGYVAKTEGYPKDWARVVLMVAPDGTMHAIGGEREPGKGDTPYIGLERIKKKLAT